MAGFKEYQMLFQLNASLGSSYSSAFTSGGNAIKGLQDKIENLNRTQSDIAAFEKQQKAVENSRAKMELYTTQLDNLKNATANTSVEEAKLANEIAAKEAQLQKATTAYDNANAKLSDMGQKLREAGVDTGNLSSEEARLAQEAQNAANEQAELAAESAEMGQSFKTAMEGAAAAMEAAGLVAGLKQIYDALSECSKTAMEYETAMAGVKRTVGGDDAFIDDLAESFKEMSTVIPITANELANIATTAGQLGISQQNVEAFTTVMAQLGTTTDLTADNAATMLAQFSNITGVTDYERLGSTVAQLGDATATTASKVVNMSQGMAASASIAGMSATDILAISAAVGSLGIEAQAGSTAMSTLISTLYKATETGENLEAFASVAGMSAEEFKTAWGKDAVGAMNSFIQGLNDTERNGRSAVVILDELGITNVRQTKAILGLAQAGDLLSNTVQSANEAWSSNTALAEKAGIMYNTTEAKMTMMQNAANNVSVAIGDALNPALGVAYDAAAQLLQPIAEFIEDNPELVQGIVAFVGVLGTAAVAITTVTAAMKLWTTANTLLGASIPGVGVILGVAAAVGVLVGAISSMGGDTETAAEQMASLNSEYDSLMDEIENQQSIIDLCGKYSQLSADVSDATDSINELVKAAEDEIDVKAHVFDPIDPSQFVTGDTVQLKPGQASYLAANDFLTGAQVKLTPQQASYLASKEFLTDTTVKITPEQAKQLQSWQFLYSTQVQLTPEQKKLLKSAEFIDGTTTITLTAKQATKLAAAGFMDGTTVELTASQAKELAAAGFMEDTTVQLTPEAKPQLEASVFMKDSNVDLTADITNMADLEKQIEGLAGKASTAKGMLDEARSSLAESQKTYELLEAQMTDTNNRKLKTTIQQQMEDVAESIEAQQLKVSSLEETYGYLNGKCEAAVKVYNDLKTAQDELSETGDALIAASEGRITSLETETEALNKQLETEEKLARVRQAQARQSASDNMTEQAKAYVQAINDLEESTKKLETIDKQIGALDSAENYAARLQAAFDAVASAINDGEDWDSSNVKALRNEFTELANAVNELPFDMYFDSLDQMDIFMNDLDVSTLDVVESTAELGNKMDDTGRAAEEAAAAMQTYIENAVDMATKGGAGIEEIRKKMEADFAAYPNGAQIVENAMAQVEAAVNSAASAADDASGSMDGLNQSLSDTQKAEEEARKALEGLEGSLADLRAAYDEAYQSAYDSIDKQIGLFDEINVKSNKSVKEMVTALESQETALKNYAKNLREAARLGLDEGLLKSLSDGSVQSMAFVETIVQGGESAVYAINEAAKGVEDAKDKAAAAAADMATDFTKSSTTIQSDIDEIKKSLDGLDGSSAGVELGSTLAAGIRSTIETVRKAAAELKAAATVDAGTGSGALATTNAKNTNITMAYASGTQSAKRGLALVGEEGPELMWMNGGETIATAEETARIARQATVEASPLSASIIDRKSGKQFSIEIKQENVFNGQTNESDVRNELNAQTQNLRRMMEQVLRDIDSDRVRSAYQI